MANGPEDLGGVPLGTQVSEALDAAEAVKKTRELVEAQEAFVEAVQKAGKELDKKSLSYETLVASLAEANAEQEKLQKQYDKASSSLKEQLDIETAFIEAQRQEINAQISILQLIEKKTDEQEKALALLQEQEKTLRFQSRYYNQIDNQTKSLTKTVFGLGNAWEDSVFKAIQETGEKGLGRMVRQFENLLQPQEIFYAFALKIFEATIMYNKELIEATATLNKSTGMAERFSGHINSAATDFMRLGLSLGDAANNLGSMIENFSDFTTLAPNLQKSLLATSAQFAALGIEADTFGQNLMFLTRNMGMSTEQAVELNKDLVTFAESIGVAPAKFVKEFAEQMPKLEVYGNRAVEVFKKLEMQAKASGIGVDELMSATAKMDTFEGAAEAAGQLNAALGGSYFDSLELLMASEDERIDIIKNTINATGIQFDQLGKFNKLLLANAAGFEDVAKFERMLNGETEGLSETQKEFNQIVNMSATLFSNLKTMAMSLAVGLGPVINAFTKLTGWIAQSEAASRIIMAGFFVGLPLLLPKIVAGLGMFIKGGLTLGVVFKKLLLPLGIFLSVMQGIIGIVDRWNTTDNKIGLIFTGIGQAIADFFYEPIRMIAGIFGAELPKADIFKMAGFADGVTGFQGGTALVGERGPELVTMGQGSNVITNENLGKLMNDLTTAVNSLNNGGRPIQVNLVVDGKKLASAVHNNTEYLAI